jgi:hypothetical protein
MVSSAVYNSVKLVSRLRYLDSDTKIFHFHFQTDRSTSWSTRCLAIGLREEGKLGVRAYDLLSAALRPVVVIA